MIARYARRLVLAALLMMSVNASATSANVLQVCDWPLWQGFVTDFVQADGRVVDANTPNMHSTSESQAYGMLFALIANDREQFKKIWGWTEQNLLNGDVQKNLPAWQWGKSAEGLWKVLDRNAASDADTWMVYALFEAARLWKVQDYAERAKSMLRLIKEREVQSLPGIGLVLMPGPLGYVKHNSYRLNASYWPIPVIRRFALLDKQGQWTEINANHIGLISAMSPNGFVPDWALYQKDMHGNYAVTSDFDKGAIGSYDAIRVYLWAGMTPVSDPLAMPLMKSISGHKNALYSGKIPEKVDVMTGAGSGDAPVGFYAALLPYFSRVHGMPSTERMLGQIYERFGKEVQKAREIKHQPMYYDYVLMMFGSGWIEQRYRFLPDGKIKLKWETEC